MSTRRQRRVDAGLAPEIDSRSIQVGILATLILHLLLILVIPELSVLDRASSQTVGAREEEEFFELQLEPDDEEALDPFRFVEVNPDVPDNVPDDTINFGAQNQQVAQEEPTPDGDSDNPAIEGETDVESTQIVDGRLNQPNLPPEPAVPESEAVAEQTPATPQQMRNPLSGFEEFVGDDLESVGSNIAQVLPNAEAIPEPIDGVPDAPQNPGVGLYAQVDPMNPRPRQRVERDARPAIFRENLIGTSNIGPVAYNAKWSAYGEYLQKMIEVIQVRWENAIQASQTYPNRGTMVTISFILNSLGEVTEISSVDGSANDQATNWCVAAISPDSEFSFGEWTDDMIAILGDEQELTFRFLYR